MLRQAFLPAAAAANALLRHQARRRIAARHLSVSCALSHVRRPSRPCCPLFPLGPHSPPPPPSSHLSRSVKWPSTQTMSGIFDTDPRRRCAPENPDSPTCRHRSAHRVSTPLNPCCPHLRLPRCRRDIRERLFGRPSAVSEAQSTAQPLAPHLSRQLPPSPLFPSLPPPCQPARRRQLRLRQLLLQRRLDGGFGRRGQRGRVELPRAAPHSRDGGQPRPGPRDGCGAGRNATRSSPVLTAPLADRSANQPPCAAACAAPPPVLISPPRFVESPGPCTQGPTAPGSGCSFRVAPRGPGARW